MYVLRKWNYKTHAYEQFVSPAISLAVYSEDMGARCDCANCGKMMTFGDGFTSRTIHNMTGLGYPVCESCYQIELQEEKIHAKED